MEASVVTPGSLSREARLRMLGLMELSYDGIVAEHFFADLDAKDGVILLRDPQGEVRGFSTFALHEEAFEGERLEILYSGDTVIEQDARGSLRLFMAFASLIRQRLEATPERRHWWFLLTKGLKTYLMMPLFFQAFHPSCERETPAAELRLLRTLCERRFPGRLDPARGILPLRADRLKPELTEGPQSAGDSPHARHFLSINPEYHLGDELPCLCSLERENLRPRSVRMVFP